MYKGLIVLCGCLILASCRSTSVKTVVSLDDLAKLEIGQLMPDSLKVAFTQKTEKGTIYYINAVTPNQWTSFRAWFYVQHDTIKSMYIQQR